eukprot:m.111622 g.111622  ORF g.111622 m.111622 type:complete len:338 (+) comp12940_c0_seq1:458-1471(+)
MRPPLDRLQHPPRLRQQLPHWRRLLHQPLRPQPLQLLVQPRLQPPVQPTAPPLHRPQLRPRLPPLLPPPRRLSTPPLHRLHPQPLHQPPHQPRHQQPRPRLAQPQHQPPVRPPGQPPHHLLGQPCNRQQHLLQVPLLHQQHRPLRVRPQPHPQPHPQPQPQAPLNRPPLLRRRIPPPHQRVYQPPCCPDAVLGTRTGVQRTVCARHTQRELVSMRFVVKTSTRTNLSSQVALLVLLTRRSPMGAPTPIRVFSLVKCASNAWGSLELGRCHRHVLCRVVCKGVSLPTTLSRQPTAYFNRPPNRRAPPYRTMFVACTLHFEQRLRSVLAISGTGDTVVC